MPSPLDAAVFQQVCAVVLKAGEAIMKLYNDGTASVATKEDSTPLTLADKASHDCIVNGLSFSGIPLLSEEGSHTPYNVRQKWQRYWLVDPLDGTKEFIRRNGEFTVNVALIDNGLPALGVVYAPALGVMYWGGPGWGAWKREAGGEACAMRIGGARKVRTIVASRSHISEETLAYVQRFPGAELISMGSSLKLMLVADGTADIYPRFGPTMEWDIAAAHAILLGAGGRLYQPGGNLFTYNKPELLNPWFIADGTTEDAT